MEERPVGAGDEELVLDGGEFLERFEGGGCAGAPFAVHECHMPDIAAGDGDEAGFVVAFDVLLDLDDGREEFPVGGDVEVVEGEPHVVESAGVEIHAGDDSWDFSDYGDDSSWRGGPTEVVPAAFDYLEKVAVLFGVGIHHLGAAKHDLGER